MTTEQQDPTPTSQGADQLSAEEQQIIDAAFNSAREGQTERLTALLNAGLPANLTNDKGDTLLILASYYGHTETVIALLEAGAERDRVNDRGQTALSAATFRKDEDTVRALLDGGADPTVGAVSAVMVADQFGLPDFAILFQENSDAI